MAGNFTAYAKTVKILNRTKLAAIYKTSLAGNGYKLNDMKYLEFVLRFTNSIRAYPIKNRLIQYNSIRMAL